MPSSDFDIDGLAAYLHMTPQQVQRLADREKIPGRRVGGSWRFSRSEIHHWLEVRIGLSDEEELVDVEDVLQRSAGPHDASVSIADSLPIEAIAVPLMARTRNSVHDRMADLAAATGWLWDPGKMADATRKREELHSTALDNGIALLHPRRPLDSILGQSFLALGITASGIPFGGGHDNLTDVFFLICSMGDQEHLRTLARLSRILAIPGFAEQLREQANPTDVWKLIDVTERQLPG